MIQRYTHLLNYSYEPDLVPREDGEWVKYEDHERIVEALEAEIRALNERLSEDGL